MDDFEDLCLDESAMTRTACCWDWVRPFQSPNSLYFGQQKKREEHDPAIATCGQRNKKTEADFIWPQFAEAATTCSGRKTLAQFQTGCCPGVAPARDRGSSGKKRGRKRAWREALLSEQRQCQGSTSLI